MPCVYLPGPAPAVTVANNQGQTQRYHPSSSRESPRTKAGVSMNRAVPEHIFALCNVSMLDLFYDLAPWKGPVFHPSLSSHDNCLAWLL